MHSIVYLLYVIWCSHVIHLSGETLNSCNNTLQYQREGNETVGWIEIQSPPSTKTLKLDIVLSLPGQLPSLYVGEIEPFRTVADAVQKFRSNQLVQYKVRFPLQDPLPKLKELSINGQAICTEPPETGSLITEIRLGYTLFTEQAHPPQGHAIEQTYTSKPQQQYTETNATTSPIEGEVCGTLHKKYNSKVLPLSIDSAGKGTWPWPWLVSIYSNIQNATELHCAGTLISHRTVVTAASCFRTKNRTVQANEVILIFGQDNIVGAAEYGSKNGIDELVIHKDFITDVFDDADIALAIMRESVDFTEFIRPVCLWKGSDKLNSVVGDYGTVIGWRTDNYGDVRTSATTKITLPIVSRTECLRSSSAYQNTSQRTFCAGNRDGRGLCDEDRGNGMMFRINDKWMLRGIFSSALSDAPTHNCNLREYLVFTDAAKFVDWIELHMR